MTLEKDIAHLKGIQSIEIGSRLLVAMIEAGQPVNLGTVARAAGMSASKARRYLISFTRSGFVEQDSATGLYDLSWFAIRLGLAALGRQDMIRSGRPLLRQLRQELGETTAMVVWGKDGPTVVLIDESDRNLVRLVAPVGAALPILSTAGGQIFGAFMPAPATAAMIERELQGISPYGKPAGIAGHDDVDRLFGEIRTRRLARTVGSVVEGVSTMAAPAFDANGKIVAGLVSLGQKSTFDSRWNGRVATALKKAAADLSQTLGLGL
jgi:DNA-binding IclR family transcriptional regulator